VSAITLQCPSRMTQLACQAGRPCQPGPAQSANRAGLGQPHAPAPQVGLDHSDFDQSLAIPRAQALRCDGSIARLRTKSAACRGRPSRSLRSHDSRRGVCRRRTVCRRQGGMARNLSCSPTEPLLHVVRPRPLPQTLPSRSTDARPAYQFRNPCRPARSLVLPILRSEPAARPRGPGVR
jgi:hypothetical protein